MPLPGGTLVALFGVGQEAADIGQTFFRSISPFYIFFGISTALRGYVEGMGKLFVSSLIGILALFIRICLSYLLAPVFGNMSIAYSEGVQWVFMLMLYLLFLFSCRKVLLSQKSI